VRDLLEQAIAAATAAAPEFLDQPDEWLAD